MQVDTDNTGIKNKLIVALDGDWELDELLSIAKEISLDAGMVKLGKKHFTKFGPKVVRELVKLNLPVFLDLKFHDIPNTVFMACKEAVKLGCSMLNVHASGGREMMLKAREGVDQAAKELGIKAPKLIAVTVLTSLNEEALQEVGIHDKVESQVIRLAKLAYECGLDGVVASPKEVKLIRKELGNDFLVVSPGIRPAGKVANDDQSRVMTPADAVKAGVSQIVVGRPVYASENPAKSAKEIVAQMEGA